MNESGSDIDASIIVGIGLAGAAAVTAIVFAVQGIAFYMDRQDEMKKWGRTDEYVAYQKDAEEKLTAYGWQDEAKKTVRIPIDKAIAMVAEKGSVAPKEDPNAKPVDQMTPEEYGQQLYTQNACVGCHSLNGTRLVGPTFKGLWGAQRKFTDGSTAKADEKYLATSILQSKAQIVEGYPPVMPNFQGQLKDDQIKALIAFIKAQK